MTSTATIVTITDELGRDTKEHYDALDRLVKVERPDPTGGSQLTTTEHFYDKSGNLVRLIDAEQNETRYEYDELGRVTKITEADPDGELEEYENPVTTYSYDAAGNLQSQVDPNGRLTTYHYDAANRLVAMIEPDVDGTVTSVHHNLASAKDVNADGVANNLDFSILSAYCSRPERSADAECARTCPPSSSICTV